MRPPARGRRRGALIDQLELPTKCAVRKAVGHWARECPQGRSLTAFTAAGSTFFAHDNPKHFQLHLLVAMTMVSVFIGDALDAPGALLDTGARTGGDSWRKAPQRDVLEKLDVEGLPYERHAEDDIGEAPRGIGGSATLVHRISVPSGLVETNGVLRFKVVREGVPPLIPVALTRALEMQLELSPKGDVVLFGATGRRAS